MQWPQITWIVLAVMGLVIAIVKHGDPRAPFNGWHTLIRLAVMVLLLWLGGFFTSAHAQTLPNPPPQANAYRAELTRAAHSQWGLDAPIAALAAQVHQESAWRPNAVSRVGAIGMAQFMPATAQWWCQLNGLNSDDCQPSNPTWALRALVGYDRYLYVRAPQRFNTHDRLWVALRGYNGGLGHWLAEAKATGLPAPSRDQVDAACGRARRSAVHCPENLSYPRRILQLQALYAAWGAGV